MAEPEKPDRNRNDGGNPWKAIGLVSALGIDLAVCAFAGFYAGGWLDEKLGGTGIWIAVSVLAGLAVGGISVAMVIRKVLRNSNE
ncbi:AtpZ/AtpI family protein [Paenibacillus medicaginis]|uniref:AtpZ/AtpI family protein n=1 Tax=Paenibacillus medicaginis TaxID=1470560 RepID=A0ABV5BXB4_9BACL